MEGEVRPTQGVEKSFEIHRIKPVQISMTIGYGLSE